MEEVGFANQSVEPDTKPAEQLEVVAEDIPNLVDVGMEVGFHDQLVEFDMETAEHLIMDDLVAVGGELCIVEHLVVSNEIVSLACIDGDLHVGADVEFVVVEDISNLVDARIEVGFHDQLVESNMETTKNFFMDDLVW